MKLAIKKSTLIKFIKILKWGKIIAKLAAIGTTISGAVTALSGSATTGVALSAAGATTYAAAKGIPNQGYEKTKHVPPGRVNKTANTLRQQEMEAARARDKKMKTLMGKAMPMAAIPTKQAAMRGSMPTGHLMRKK